MGLQDLVSKYKPQIDAEIAEELEKRLQDTKSISPHLVPILEAMQELSVGGKRLRAMLTIMGYQIGVQHTANGVQQEQEIIKAAVVMELFHLGLLIQDDFMDRDMVRRGVKTLIARYEDEHQGNFVSMLAGDYTFGWGMEVIAKLQSPITNNQIVKAMQVWGKYFTRVGYGQTLDGLDIADDVTILKILAIKSGEYSCVLPLLLGATLGGADKKLLSILEKYGMELGWVFQLRDDWLGYDKDMAKKGKRTYATMYGKEKTEEAIKEHMIQGKKLAMGNEMLEALLIWVGTRDN